MTIGATELKLGFDVFSKLLSWATGVRNNKKLEKLKSEAFREMLKGDTADLSKVAAAIRKLRKAGDDSTDTERLVELHTRIITHAKAKKAPKTYTKKAVAKPKKMKVAMRKSYLRTSVATKSVVK